MNQVQSRFNGRREGWPGSYQSFRYAPLPTKSIMSVLWRAPSHSSQDACGCHIRKAKSFRTVLCFRKGLHIINPQGSATISDLDMDIFMDLSWPKKVFIIAFHNKRWYWLGLVFPCLWKTSDFQLHIFFFEGNAFPLGPSGFFTTVLTALLILYLTFLAFRIVLKSPGTRVPPWSPYIKWQSLLGRTL